MLLLYNIFIRLYYSGVRVTSLWNRKAEEWRKGRKNVFYDLKSRISTEDRMIWMHCSSAGEFEQGKPVIEALKRDYPQHRIVVSFFSPSGFAVAARYVPADIVTYLPLDTRQNARTFIELIRPELVIFVKYEFWYHHLAAAACHHIPILLISASFRKNQVFFKTYGVFFRRILFLFRHIFVQDEASLELLKSNDINHCSISGDTRFDRVETIKANAGTVDRIAEFIGTNKTIVAGSTWQDDEELLKNYLCTDQKTKLIIAPHEIHETHIKAINETFTDSVLYSVITSQAVVAGDPQVLIIDSVGLLSRLYQYATITYVGGGFTKDGIHNVLEAAVWGKPVLFGPNYKKYREAKELIRKGGGFSLANGEEFKKLADSLLIDEHYLQAVSQKAKMFVRENTGATEKILQEIQAKRLLTS